MSAIQWRPSKEQYVWGDDAYLGKWRVGGAYNDGSRNKDAPNKWAATFRLPGLATSFGHYPDQEQAKARVEQAVAHWLEGAGVQSCN